MAASKKRLRFDKRCIIIDYNMSWLVPFDFEMYGPSSVNHALDRFQHDMRRFERDVLGGVGAMHRVRPPGPPPHFHDFTSEPGLGPRYGMMTGESTDDQGQKNFNMHFIVKTYKPEEIKVSVDGRTLMVDAKHEEVLDNGRIHKEFHRAFALPDNVDIEKMKSNLKQGMLSIQAPMTAPPAAEGQQQSTAIPIEFVKK